MVLSLMSVISCNNTRDGIFSFLTNNSIFNGLGLSNQICYNTVHGTNLDTVSRQKLMHELVLAPLSASKNPHNKTLRLVNVQYDSLCVDQSITNMQLKLAVKFGVLPSVVRYINRQVKNDIVNVCFTIPMHKYMEFELYNIMNIPHTYNLYNLSIGQIMNWSLHYQKLGTFLQVGFQILRTTNMLEVFEKRQQKYIKEVDEDRVDCILTYFIFSYEQLIKFTQCLLYAQKKNSHLMLVENPFPADNDMFNCFVACIDSLQRMFTLGDFTLNDQYFTQTIDNYGKILGYDNVTKRDLQCHINTSREIIYMNVQKYMQGHIILGIK
jgi:hypothetical protein